ncbi:dTDP-4-dehydrorhamnose 3,5-epimerase [Thermodesulfobacteriota bacterium]
MKITPLKLEGTFAISLKPMEDERGYFMRTYDESIFKNHGLNLAWVQENQSLSKHKGIIRGLHFQKPPHSETKLVRVAKGAILDVFMDLRKGSKTYGKWDAIELSEENQQMVYIPKGFAHGFCTLSEESLVLYKVDNFYTPEAEGGLRWNDNTLGIDWPVKDPLVSPKDQKLGLFKDFVSPF